MTASSCSINSSSSVMVMRCMVSSRSALRAFYLCGSQYDDLLTSSYWLCSCSPQVGTQHSPPGTAAGLSCHAVASGEAMHRSIGGLAAICWFATAGASAQDAKPTRLPAVEVDAPHSREEARTRPRSDAARDVRSGRKRAKKPIATAAAGSVVGTTPGPPVGSSSEKIVSGEDVNARPFSRPGEALEVAPGLIVTQHSGDGKANQYFLRGFNHDHGTNLAISVNDMPVNMRTHAHGQGYADLNFLIPELIGSVDIRKGPYFADEGDFSSVGSLHVGLLDSINKTMASITSGSFGYQRILGITPVKFGEGTLLLAAEVNA